MKAIRIAEARGSVDQRYNDMLETALRLAGIDPKGACPDRQARELASNDIEVLSELFRLAGQGDIALDSHYMLCLSDMLQRISHRLATADDLIGLLAKREGAAKLGASET